MNSNHHTIIHHSSVFVHGQTGYLPVAYHWGRYFILMSRTLLIVHYVSLLIHTSALCLRKHIIAYHNICSFIYIYTHIYWIIWGSFIKSYNIELNVFFDNTKRGLFSSSVTIDIVSSNTKIKKSSQIGSSKRKRAKKQNEEIAKLPMLTTFLMITTKPTSVSSIVVTEAGQHTILSAKDNFRINAFPQVIDALSLSLVKKGKAYKDINRFGFFCNLTLKNRFKCQVLLRLKLSNGFEY